MTKVQTLRTESGQTLTPTMSRKMRRKAEAMAARAASPMHSSHLPAQFVARPSLGEKLLQSGKHEDALPLIMADHKREPKNGGHLSNIGICYQLAGYPDVAIEWFEKSVAVDPTNANAWSSMGASLSNVGRTDDAIEAFRHAVEANPEHVDALSNLAITLKEKRLFDEAYQANERALLLRPKNPTNHSNLIFTMEMDPRTTPEKAQAARRRWWRSQRLDWRYTTWANDPDPERPLNIGYVSSDFRRHSALYTFAPMIFERDRENFKITAFHCAVAEDDVTGWVANTVDRWFTKVSTTDGNTAPLGHVSDNDLARIVRDSNIDILVDLSGHTAGHRLPMFTAHPAPVQVTAVGCMTGTGCPEVDWFMADPVLVPEEIRPLFAERIWDLPSAFTYSAPDYAPDVPEAPCVENGYVTFGCLNRFSKVSVETLAAWGELMAKVPTARLYLKDATFGVESGRARFLAESGIDPERVIFETTTPHLDHLRAHAKVDICLDPWPQAGGTSSLEALWMGCQLVTLKGATPCHRASASIGAHLPKDVHVATSAAEYVELAMKLAASPAKLAKRRRGIRERMTATPVAGTRAWMEGVEQAYRGMWRLWCAEQRAQAAA